ncbi:DUF2059 domain-containing protein [Rufibacter tibetensis]|uniref:DUF2059 domain-containing protein n=1 Tax=Rufibacter tibetensis TaxID=512763 RepID=UPI000783E266|nr:DUF2059 domain-containing protein [Rufibacter tibetensis]
MKKIFSLWVFLLVVSAGSAMAQTQSSHYKAAETLLLTMGSPKTIDDNLQQMLTMQMEQVPAMKAAEVEVRSFFSKYMNWDAVKGDLIKLYMDEFTEKELKELNAFYLTPVGKKMAQKQSVITMKSAQIGQAKVEPHMMELQQAIQNKMQGDN